MTTPTEPLKQFLEATPFFGGLDDKSFQRLLSMMVERSCPAGSTVFREGEDGKSMYVIHSGEVVMYRAAEKGKQVRLMRLKAGDFFGETTLIEMQPRPYTARVEKPTTLFELTNMDLYRLYREDIKAYVLVLQNINRELCRRLRKSDTRIAQVAEELGGEDTTQIRTAPGFRLPKRT